MARGNQGRWGLVLPAVLTLLAGCGEVSSTPGPASAPPSANVSSQPTSAPDRNQDPAPFAPQVVAQAGRSGVNPELLMAILYNESDKPHDPAVERQWQRIKPDAAFGIANMHRAAFDQAMQGRDFASRDWQELPDHPDLAIKAAAWYLHDLAMQLPATHSTRYTKDELLALGYNAGPSNMRAFARGDKPAAVAQSYLDRLRANWLAAQVAIHHCC